MKIYFYGLTEGSPYIVSADTELVIQGGTRFLKLFNTNCEFGVEPLMGSIVVENSNINNYAKTLEEAKTKLLEQIRERYVELMTTQDFLFEQSMKLLGVQQ